MLTSIRAKSGSLLVKLLFVLLIAVFAVWGIGDVLRPSPGAGPIEVGSRTINVATIDREFQDLLQQSGEQFGFQMGAFEGIQLGLLDRAIDNLVNRALIDNFAEDLGLRTNDDTISAFIRDEMGFRTQDGRFDRPRFEQWLQGRRITEQAFVEQLRRDIARQELLQTLVGGVRIPRPIAETLRAYRAETRVAEFVRVSADAMPEPEAPAEDQLQAYYDAHGDAYMAPEYRSGSVVLLDPDTIAEDVTVDEEQLNEEFLYRQDQLFIPERREIEQMILADADQAEAAEAALAEGQVFAEVAAGVAGQDPASLAMGRFSAEDWFVPEAADALFGGDVGATSEAVETPLGWRIYRVAAIEPAREPALEEVRDDLTREIAFRIAQDTLLDDAAQLQDEIAGGATLAEAAETLGLAPEPIPLVSADGLSLEGGEAAVPGGQPVRDALFAAEPDGPVDLGDLPNGGVFALAVHDVVAPAQRPLDEVRDQVLADWTAEQKLEAARAQAAEIEDALEAGVPLAEAAAARDLTVETATGVSRDGEETGGLPRDLGARLFELAPGEAASAEAGDAFVVAQLREVVPAPDDADAARTAWLQLSSQMTNDVFQALGAALVARHEPLIARDQIQQQFIQSYGSQGAAGS